MKVNMRVRLKPNRYIDDERNPEYGGRYGKAEGTIKELNNKYITYSTTVLWDLGTTNFYKEGDLILINNSKQLTLF